MCEIGELGIFLGKYLKYLDLYTLGVIRWSLKSRNQGWKWKIYFPLPNSTSTNMELSQKKRLPWLKQSNQVAYNIQLIQVKCRVGDNWDLLNKTHFLDPTNIIKLQLHTRSYRSIKEHVVILIITNYHQFNGYMYLWTYLWIKYVR